MSHHFISYFSDNFDQTNIEEIILTDTNLSLNHQNDIVLDPSLIKKNIYSIEADRLIETNQFENYYTILKEYIDQGVKLIRIKDLGLLDRLFQDYSDEVKVILNLETAHHNFHSINFYEKKYGDFIDRFIISTEITFDNLKEIIQKLKTKVELYVLGPILLFYTPRKLLSNQINEEFQQSLEDRPYLKASGTSMESPHSGFSLYENQAGTLMYAPNHFCLLDMLEKLKSIGVDFFRIDLRGLPIETRNKIESNYLKGLDEESYQDFKNLYPHRILKGLFVVNKSKVLFKKLKNKTLENIQDHVATVVEVVKDSHLVFKQETDRVLKIGDEIQLLSPDKREKIVKINQLKSISGVEVDQTRQGEHFIIKSIPAISVKSKIRKIN